MSLPVHRYEEALAELPDLLEHLAHLVVPGMHMGDGQPRARDLTPAPARLNPMDQIDFSFAELWKMEDYFRERLPRFGFADTSHMVRCASNGEPVGVASVVADTSETLRKWTVSLTGRLRAWWPDVVAHEAFPVYRDLMDVWLIRPLRAWPLEGRAPVPARPRACPECGGEVWADLQLHGARCDSCRWQQTVPQWIPIRDAAERVGRDVRQLERWIADDGIGMRKVKGRRYVELHECMEWRDFLAARRARNLPALRDHQMIVQKQPNGDWEVTLAPNVAVVC